MLAVQPDGLHVWKMSERIPSSYIFIYDKVCGVSQLQIQLAQVLGSGISPPDSSLSSHQYTDYLSDIRGNGFLCSHFTPALIQFYLVAAKNMKWFLSLNTVWNLAFLRPLYAPFCLHPDSSLLLVSSLDYIVGIYPLLLIFLSYMIVKLHDRSVWCVRLCKPATKLLSLIHRKWDIRTSLVKEFHRF